ncbi:hypothetical protein [Cupriavidus consociatus]|uniref:hypothetical protein n=1 Tax=Cupriavidus consociatus TaxID=2821357 RepID=UPI001AE788E6|nr:MULTISPECIES: hypothetical protein [unclassified Cupriavidus]MBP0621862.1 hypothetical protein [Cupriavidus sp. LEh25]
MFLSPGGGGVVPGRYREYSKARAKGGGRRPGWREGAMRRGLLAGGTASRHQRTGSMRWPGTDTITNTCRKFSITVLNTGKTPLQP